jgi:pyruvate kinase
MPLPRGTQTSDCTAPMLCDMCAQVHASLIVVLTRGGSTARLVAKYRPSIPVLTVAVPVLTTDSLTWSCSGTKLTEKPPC